MEIYKKFNLIYKEQIQKKYSSGITIEEINQELIKIYGEEISFNPPKNHILLGYFFKMTWILV